MVSIDTEQEEDESLDWRKLLLFILFSVVFLYIARDWGFYTISKNWAILVSVAALYLIGMLPYWISKYKMPQVNVDGYHGSFQHNQSPQLVPDYYLTKHKTEKNVSVRHKFNWLVYACGSSLMPVPTKGKDAVLIVPQEQIDTRSKNHRGSTQVFPCSLYQLPQSLYTFLVNNKSNYNLDKIYIGYHDRSFKPKDSLEDSDKDLMIKQLQEQNNQKSKMLMGDYSEFQKMQNLVNKLTPKPTIFDKVFSRNPNADQSTSS